MCKVLWEIYGGAAWVVEYLSNVRAHICLCICLCRDMMQKQSKVEIVVMVSHMYAKICFLSCGQRLKISLLQLRYMFGC